MSLGAAVEDKGFFFLMCFSTPELCVWATPTVLVPSLMRLGYSPVLLPPAAFNGLKRFSSLRGEGFRRCYIGV